MSIHYKTRTKQNNETSKMIDSILQLKGIDKGIDHVELHFILKIIVNMGSGMKCYRSTF